MFEMLRKNDDDDNELDTAMTYSVTINALSISITLVQPNALVSFM